MVEPTGEKPPLQWSDLSADEAWDAAVILDGMHEAIESMATSWLAGQALIREGNPTYGPIYAQLPVTIVKLMPEIMVVNETTKTWLGQQIDGVRQQGTRLTDSMVGELLDMSPAHISRVLNRSRALSLDTFARACDVFADLLPVPDELRDHFVQGHIVKETARLDQRKHNSK